MRGWVIGGVALAVVAVVVAGVLVVPVRAEAVSAPVQTVTIPVGSEASGLCGTVAVSAALDAEVRTPLVDALGIVRLTGIEASELVLDLAIDPACGEDQTLYSGFAVIANGVCGDLPMPPDEESSPEPSRCGGTAIWLDADAPGTPTFTAHWSGQAYPLGDARVSGGRWCARVDAGLSVADGAASGSDNASLPEALCLELP